MIISLMILTAKNCFIRDFILGFHFLLGGLLNTARQHCIKVLNAFPVFSHILLLSPSFQELGAPSEALRDEFVDGHVSTNGHLPNPQTPRLSLDLKIYIFIIGQG